VNEPAPRWLANIKTRSTALAGYALPTAAGAGGLPILVHVFNMNTK